MNWDDLRALITLSKEKTFTHAASELEISVATLTRKIDRLESALSLPLVRRSPSGIKMTPEGDRILSMAKQGGEYLGQVERVASAIASGEMRDPVRISSTEPVIADILAPRIDDLYRTYPEIQLDLMVSAEISNLQRQEADLAIRLTRPREPALITRKLAEVDFGVYAARSLIEGLPEERSWRDLPFIGFDSSYGDIPERRWLDSKGIRSNVYFLSSSTRAQLNMVKSGVGAAILPTYMAHLDSDIIKLETPTIARRQLWLVFHRDIKNQKTLTHVREWVKRACEAALS